MVSSLFERGRDDPEVVGGEVAGRDCQDEGFARLYRDMVERIVSRHGTRILYWAQYLGYGSRDYRLVHVR